MSRYRAAVAYDGTDFLGFQRQATGRTVQAELEAALGRLGCPVSPVAGAGRTDSGVHAAGQVVAFEADWRHGPEALLRAINAHLPNDVVIAALAPAPPDFHPRTSARRRRYRYTVYQSATRQPHLERTAWRVWPPLAKEPLGRAAAMLLGEHDFAAFGTAPESGGPTRRHVWRSEWTKDHDERFDGELLHYHVEANAFLFRMVRSLVGSLRQVGHGELTPEEFQDVLNSADRRRAGPAAPAHGLCLMEVTYPAMESSSA